MIKHCWQVALGLVAMVMAITLGACVPTVDISNKLLPLPGIDSSIDQASDEFTVPSADPGVLTGQFSNGFKYYLRSANGASQNDRMEVRLVVRAGSLNEKPDQRGYAHLLEHMAYRGTKSFSAQSIERLLSTNGLRWGQDINATTHYGATVYRFSLAQNEEHLLPVIFKLMAEWLEALTFDVDALDSEKRIVDSEWRERYGDRNYVIDPVTASAYEGSIYANRQPAGEIASIQNASIDGLRQFWRSHYRPDNAALVVTGSERPWKLEPTIQQAFEHLDNRFSPETSPAPKIKTDERKSSVLLFADGNLIELQSYSDRTLLIPELSINFISSLPDPDNSLTAAVVRIENQFRNQLLFSAYSYLLQDRIAKTPVCSSILLQAAPLESGQIAEQVSLSVSQDHLLSCLAVAFDAVEAVQNTRLTEEEFLGFKRLFNRIMQSNMDQYRNRNAVALADDLVEQVKNNDHMLAAWDMQNILARVIEDLDREALNQQISGVSESHKTVFSMVTNQSLPIPMSDMIAAVSSDAELHALNEPLLENSGGIQTNSEWSSSQKSFVVPSLVEGLYRESPTVTRVESDDKTYKWQLDNGATVVLLPDDRYDHIALTAIKSGGYAYRTSASARVAKALPAYLSNTGVNGYSGRTLRREMNQRQISVQPFVSALHQGVHASGSASEIESLLTIVDGYFTKPLIREPHSTNFLRQLRASKTDVQWHEKIQSETDAVKTKNATTIDSSAFAEIHRELFGSADGFLFVFVGAIEPDELERQLQRLSTGVNSRSSSAPAGTVSLPVPPIRVNRDADSSAVSLLLSCQGAGSVGDVHAQDSLLQRWRLLSDVIAERLRYSLREELGVVYDIKSELLVSGQLNHKLDFSVHRNNESIAIAAVRKILTDLPVAEITGRELAGAKARDKRSHTLKSADFQSIATDRALQVLFGGTPKMLDSESVTVKSINEMADCIQLDDGRALQAAVQVGSIELLDVQAVRADVQVVRDVANGTVR